MPVHTNNTSLGAGLMRKAELCAVAAIASVVFGACRDDITVPNYNNPTPAGVASDPNSLQLLANGIAFQLGASAPPYIDDLGTLGRESYQYTPTEGRNFTAYVQNERLDRAGFAGVANWNGRYINLRNIFNLQAAVAAAPASVPAQQKSAANGFGTTMEALELYYVIATRDTNGAPVEVSADINFVAPFVSRDSVYRYISAQLEAGAAQLQGGGTAFPFAVPLQFEALGTVTPSTFLRFNRALAARVFAYRGSLGMNCGATSCYQQALTALSASFLSATLSSRPALDPGVYTIYGTGTGVTQNTLSRATGGGRLQYAHPSILRDTSGRDANGRALYTIGNAGRRSDLRVQAKVDSAAVGNPPAAISASAISTPYTFRAYATASSPIPIIRNEELLLLRAEARIGTGDLGGALSDINTVRRVYGGVATLGTLGTTAQALDALLEERRLSLLFEGHRIIDARRLNRLNTIPLDKVATSADNVRHYVNAVLPVPQAECLSRAQTPALQPASCRN